MRRGLKWLVVALAVAIAALAARSLDLHPVRISTNSMSPTITRGDWIAVRPLDGRSPGRGEIVMFRYPFRSQGRAIKRVIAVAGDTVAFGGHAVTVNRRARRISGSPVHDQPARHGVETVPPGHVFVLGDNAKVSIDSRNFGPVPVSEVIARKTLVIGHPGWVLAALVTAAAVLAGGLSLVARIRRAT